MGCQDDVEPDIITLSIIISGRMKISMLLCYIILQAEADDFRVMIEPGNDPGEI